MGKFSLAGARGGDDFLRGIGEVRGGDDGEAAVFEQLAALLDIGALEAHHHRHCKPTSRTAPITPSAIMSQRTMPPKMLTRIAFTFGFCRISLKAVVTRSRVAPPPTSRKFAG